MPPGGQPPDLLLKGIKSGAHVSMMAQTTSSLALLNTEVTREASAPPEMIEKAVGDIGIRGQKMAAKTCGKIVKR